MIKKLLFVALSLFATTICAQETTTVPTIDDVTGDFIVMNYRSYNDVQSLAEMKGFKITKVDDTTVKMSGFYMNRCLDFNAEYDATTGTISIPAATPIYDMETYMYYLYPWNDETNKVIERPIEYKYNGHDSWVCSTTIMLVAIQGEEFQPYYFSEDSKIAKCNGTTNNTSYTLDSETGEQNEFIESRSSYVVVDGNYIDIYNLLQADQYGYGVHLSGVYEEGSNEAWFSYTTTGTANDGTYRILTGCEYNEETNLPTGMSYPDTDYMGLTKATIDLENGKLDFDPMTIWPATYDESTGKLTVDEESFYEFVKSVTVTFDVEKAIEADINKVNSGNKEIEKVEFYTIDGMKVENPEHGTFIIKRTVYKDNTFNSEKIIY